MTLQQMMEMIRLRSKNIVPAEFREWETVKQFANFGLQRYYPSALRDVPWYYQTSHAFTATSNSVLKPADCQLIKCVQIPDTFLGVATPVSLPEFDTTQGMSLQQGAPENPKYREDRYYIQLYPHKDSNNVNYSGTFHYLRNFGLIDAEDFELNAFNDSALPVLHWIYQEDAIMEALRQMSLRAKGLLDTPDAIEQLLSGYKETMARIKAGLDPYVLIGEQYPNAAAGGKA